MLTIQAVLQEALLQEELRQYYRRLSHRRKETVHRINESIPHERGEYPTVKRRVSHRSKETVP